MRRAACQRPLFLYCLYFSRIAEIQMHFYRAAVVANFFTMARSSLRSLSFRLVV